MATRADKHKLRRWQDSKAFEQWFPRKPAAPRVVSGSFTEAEWRYLSEMVLRRLAHSDNPIAQQLVRIFEDPESRGFRFHTLGEE